MESGLTTGDLALMNRDGFGGDGMSFMWIFALLILANGGFGFGNKGYEPQYATQDFVQNGFNFNDLQSQNRDILNAISASNASVTSTIKDASYNNLTESRDIQAAVSSGFADNQKCCCETLRAIDGVNYNASINTAAINANTTAQTQKILDAISTNRIADMQNQINALQLQNAVAGVVRYPQATTYVSSCNPFSWGGCNANI